MKRRVKCGSRNLNIVNLLHKRQTGLHTGPARDFDILRRITCDSSSREFKSIIPGSGFKPFQGELKYGEGKVIVKVNSEMVCYDVRHNRIEMIKLWSLPAKPRWEDYLIVSEPLPAPLQPPLPHNAHKPSLIVLTATNRLQRYDLETGEMKQDFFLSKQFRYTEMTADMERNWLILSSNKVQSQIEEILVKNRDALKSFMILDYTTLQFLYQFKINRTVFSKAVKDANIFGGLLMNETRRMNSTIEAYSIDEVLGETNHADGEGEGDEEGLPYNIDIKLKPDCLLQVNSANHHLEVNMNPWMLIVKRADNMFGLHQLDSMDLVKGGIFGNDDYKERDESLEFCPDQPSRLIHNDLHGLTVYDIVNHGIRKYFQYDPNTEEDQPSHTNSRNKNNSRRVREVSNYYEDCGEASTHVIYDHENEMNIFGILTYTETIDDYARGVITHIKHVDLYDKDFKHLKRVKTDLYEANSLNNPPPKINFILDQDLIILSLKQVSHVSRLYIFKCRENVDHHESLDSSSPPPPSSSPSDRTSRGRRAGRSRGSATRRSLNSDSDPDYQ